MTYYDWLEIEINATKDEISSAYKHLAKKYHPDVYQGDPQEGSAIMSKINEAYNVLSDDQKRNEYDFFLYTIAKETLEKAGFSKMDIDNADEGSFQSNKNYSNDAQTCNPQSTTSTFNSASNGWVEVGKCIIGILAFVIVSLLGLDSSSGSVITAHIIALIIGGKSLGAMFVGTYLLVFMISSLAFFYP